MVSASTDVKSKLSNGINKSSTLASPLSASKMAGVPGYLFAEKFVPVLVNLFLQAPVSVKYKTFPEIVSGLGRYPYLLSPPYASICLVLFLFGKRSHTPKQNDLTKENSDQPADHFCLFYYWL